MSKIKRMKSSRRRSPRALAVVEAKGFELSKNTQRQNCDRKRKGMRRSFPQCDNLKALFRIEKFANANAEYCRFGEVSNTSFLSRGDILPRLLSMQEQAKLKPWRLGYVGIWSKLTREGRGRIRRIRFELDESEPLSATPRKFASQNRCCIPESMFSQPPALNLS